MITNRIYLAEIVSDFIEHGSAPIPIHYKSKQPINERWTELRISKNDIGTYFNWHPVDIGVLTNEPSQGLVDIDIDALKLAARFLPETKCVSVRIKAEKSLGLPRSEFKTNEKFGTTGVIVDSWQSTLHGLPYFCA